jgi:hypothetical protein
MRNKCAQHGGLSTGPKTPEGRQRCAQARTAHGRDTTTMRTERSLASARLAVLESVGFGLGLMTGTRTRGRKPDRMGEAYPELQALYQKLVIKRAKHSAKVLWVPLTPIWGVPPGWGVLFWKMTRGGGGIKKPRML